MAALRRTGAELFVERLRMEWLLCFNLAVDLSRGMRDSVLFQHQ